MAETSFLVSAALASIPLAGVVGGFIAQTLIAGRNVYINSITAERSKWIDKLRNNLAAYNSAITMMSLEVLSADDDKITDLSKQSLYELNSRASVIQLQLNPRGIIDKNILELIEHFSVFSDTDLRLAGEAKKLLIEHSQWLLKAEWERVKFEARDWFYRRKHEGDYDLLLSEYAAYAAGRGDITQVVQEFIRVRRSWEQRLRLDFDAT